jgi:hypothetical protein
MQLTGGLRSADDVNGRLPPATGCYGKDQLNSTLHIHLLPFIEADKAYDAIRAGRLDPAALTVTPFLSPLDPMESAPGVTNFAANLRVFSDLGLKTPEQLSISPDAKGNDPTTGKPWFYGTASMRSIPDGSSETIAFVTQYSVCGTAKGRNLFSNSAAKTTNSPFFGYHGPRWPASSDDGIENGRQGEVFQLAPALDNCNPSYTPHAFSTNWIVVSFFAGNARRVSANISPEVWGRLVQPNDGKPIPSDWEN